MIIKLIKVSGKAPTIYTYIFKIRSKSVSSKTGQRGGRGPGAGGRGEAEARTQGKKCVGCNAIRTVE